jgi:carboxypeptidase Taq
VGFDLDQGRLDVSHHPFCGGVPRDVRITTRYDSNDFTTALMGVLHESGHGKYEQGLPERWLHQPVGAARGMVLHESQSLLLEMQVCRSEHFLHFAAPLIREAFERNVAAQPEAFTAENLSVLYARVRRGYIRVDADEVTYPAHVLLRYDLERRLIDGSLGVMDLPEAWNAKMQSLLGLSTLGNDKDGCLQDVHWPSGAFGYFPLYSLGAMVAAQLFARAQKDNVDLWSDLRAGNFERLNAWLSVHVWQQASSLSTDEILTNATGEPLNPRWFVEHLRQRYLPGHTAS